MTDKKPEEEFVDVPGEIILSLALSSERVNAARTALELREVQLKALMMEVNKEFSEDGKFEVTSVDMEKRKIGRVRVAPKKDAAVAKDEVA